MKFYLTFVLVALLFPAIGQVHFQENKGQIVDQHEAPRLDVRFSTQANGLTVHLREQGVSYQQVQVAAWDSTQKHGVVETFPAAFSIYRTDIQWINSNPACAITAQQAVSSYANFYTAADPKGITGVRSFEAVTYSELYPGIDLLWYSRNEALEYDFRISPGADPNQIAWTIAGATALEIEDDGALLIETPLGSIRELAPVAFQGDQPVAAAWKITGNQLGFELGDYDPNLPLTIDPVVQVWGSYFGGDHLEQAEGMALDDSNNVYFAGRTQSSTAVATTGTHKFYKQGLTDAYLAKFNDSGDLVWATYYGGSGSEWAQDCAVDCDGNIYMTGETRSTTGIITVGAHQILPGSWTNNQDAFLVKFNDAGIRIWGTFYGGSDYDVASACAVDDSCTVYIYGGTGSNSMISTVGSHQDVLANPSGDAFLARFDSSGVRLWGTYLGGTDYESTTGMYIDDSAHIYVTGHTYSDNGIATSNAHLPNFTGIADGFLVKFSSSGVRQWGTYIAGTVGAPALAVCGDGQSQLYVVGGTNPNDSFATAGAFQTTNNGVSDAYLMKFDSSGAQQWCTFYGGNQGETFSGCAVDEHDNVLLIGNTTSTDVMASPGAHQSSYGGGTVDGFFAQFNPDGARYWGSYYGGGSHDYPYACTPTGSNAFYFVGHTLSATQIATSGTHQDTLNVQGTSTWGWDAFVTKFSYCTVTSDSLFVQTCDSFTGPSGNMTWYTSGQYTDTLVNSHNCDSLIFIDLEIQSTSAFQQASGCDSVSSPSGNTSWNTSGIFQDIVPNAAGCDSVITVDVSLNYSTTASLFETTCSTYTSPSGLYTWASNGTYHDTLSNLAGCDSVITIDLTVYPVDTNIILNDDGMLEATATNASFQWLGCIPAWVVMTSQTDSVFNIDTAGLFAVEVTQNGCIDTSACVTLSPIGIQDHLNNEQVSIFPNPTKGSITVDFGSTAKNAILIVRDFLGRELQRFNGINASQFQLSLPPANGAYLIEVQRKDQASSWHQVVRE